MSWTPDNRSVVFWAGGGIKACRRRVEGRQRHSVPRRGTRRIEEAVRFPRRGRAAHVRHQDAALRRSLAGRRRVVFEALGTLWIRDVAGGSHVG
jgi:hypothetical protein